ncbi:MAG: heavy metal-binding domain-containing protein [Arcobacteraceae bacterium]
MEIVHIPNGFKVVDVVTTTKITQSGFLLDEYKRLKHAVVGGENNDYEKAMSELKRIAISEIKEKAKEIGADAVCDMKIYSDIKTVKSDVMFYVEAQALALKHI